MRKFTNSVSMLVMFCLVLNVGGHPSVAQAQGGPSGNFTFPGANPALMDTSTLAAGVNAAIGKCAVEDRNRRLNSRLDKNALIGTTAAVLDRSSTRSDKAQSAWGLGSSILGAKPQGNCYDAATKSASRSSKLFKSSSGKEWEYDQASFEEALKNPTNCNMECPRPEQEDSSCADYFGSREVSGRYNDKNKTDGLKRIRAALDRITVYKRFMNFKMNNCASQEKNELMLAQQAYACTQKALSDAVSAAAAQLQMALNQQKGDFEKMSQANQQLYQQWKDINTALGSNDPDDSDPLFRDGADKNQSNQFGGLLGIQRALNQDLAEQESKGSQFKEEVENLKRDVQRNNDMLESGRMGEVSKCMSTSNSIGVAGGRALTCFKPMVDKDGRPVADASGKPRFAKVTCGPIEYLRTQVEQSALVTSGGNVVRSQNRQDEAQVRGQEFQNIADSILQDMTPNRGEGEVLSPNSTTWSDLTSKYGAALNELSQKSGVNLMGQLEKVASHCFSQGDKWRNQQIRSPSSSYGKLKAEADNRRTKLNGELQKGLGELNKNYSDAMAVLGRQAVALNRFNCTKTDPQKMLDCFDSIRSNTRDILEGTGASATVIRNDKGQPIAPPCKGINGCVTVLNNARKSKKGQVQEGRKIQAEYSTKARSDVDNQMLVLANMLKGLQGQVSAQFGSVAGLANALGVTAKTSPNMITDPEALEAAESNNAKPPSGDGPYKSPRDMSRVLSAKMQPGGMMDFANDGMGDMMASAMQKIQEKQDKAREDLASFKDVSKGLDELARTCGKEDSENVGNEACAQECDSTSLTAAGCSGSNLGDIWAALTILNGDRGAASKIEKANLALSGLKCPEDGLRKLCQNCVVTKSNSYTPPPEPNGNGNANSANQNGGNGGGN